MSVTGSGVQVVHLREKLDGTGVHIVRGGAGSPVLVLHGWGASAAAVMPIVTGLVAGHDVIAPDMPGFGESDLPPAPWAVGDYADLVLRLLDRLGIDGPVDLIGHSFGGRIGIVLAARHADRIGRLVLVDSAGIRPTPSGRVRARSLAARAVRPLRRLGPPGRGIADAVSARLASSDYRDAGPLRPTLAKVVAEDLRGYLPQIAAPTLLIWGALDDTTPLADGRLMEDSIPDAGLVVFDRAGHYAYADEPGRFNTIVAHFLQRS